MSSIPLDDVAAVWKAYRDAEAEAAKWKQAADTLKRRLQQVIGEHTEATIEGRQVATWLPTGKFAAARFAADHPDLAAKYTVTVESLDTAALQADLPDLFTAYRGRVFLAKA